MTTSDIERFHAKTTPEPNSGCLLWTGAVNSARFGYGIFRLNGRSTPAHRAAWILTHGPIASADIFVCHRCDTPECVNVDHLFLGTAADNHADMIQKGRHRVPPQKTHCPAGHEYTPDNVREYNRGRSCRACGRVTALERYYRTSSKKRRGPRGPYKRSSDAPRADIEISALGGGGR